MKAITTFSKILAGSAPLLLLAPEALASSVGSITHANLSEVPALGGFGLLLLSALLGVVSLRFMKAREKGRFFALAALSATLASAGGVNIIGNAEAGLESISLCLNETTVDIPTDGYHVVTNRSGGSRQITDITLADGCYLESVLNGGGNGAMMNGGFNGGNGGDYRGECSDDPRTRLGSEDFCDILVCCGGPNGGNGGCFEIE